MATLQEIGMMGHEEKDAARQYVDKVYVAFDEKLAARMGFLQGICWERARVKAAVKPKEDFFASLVNTDLGSYSND